MIPTWLDANMPIINTVLIGSMGLFCLIRALVRPNRSEALIKQIEARRTSDPMADGRKAVISRWNRRGFTLLELLVVISIILLVTVLAMPTIMWAMQGQQATSGAQLLQGGLMQCQSEAMKAANRRGGEANNTRTDAETLRGLRLVPESVTRLADGSIDPAAPLVSSVLVPLTIPPAYQDGRVSIYPGWAYPAAVTGGRPCLVLEESPGKWVSAGGGWAWQPNNPTSWAWNLRAGERVVFGSGGATQYVICGPITVDNPEQFVNYGPPGTGSGFARDYPSPDGRQGVRAEPEILLLVNGRDDDGDGYADNGWDGLDNDRDTVVDEPDEWTEVETWSNNQLLPTDDDTYRVIRRPVVASEPRGLTLPQGVVIDLTGWDAATGRSRLTVNRYSGAVDLMLDKTGRFSYDFPHSGTSSLGMDRAKYAHFWIGGRADITQAMTPMPAPKENAKLLTIDRAGIVGILDVNPDDPAKTLLDARRGTR